MQQKQIWNMQQVSGTLNFAKKTDLTDLKYYLD